MSIFKSFVENDPNAAEKFASAVGRVLSAAVDIDSNDDGKIDGGEWASFGVLLLMQASQNFNGWKAFLNAWTVKEQRIMIVEALAVEFDIENDEVEALIERTIFVANDNVDLAEDWVKFFNKAKKVKVEEARELMP